MNIVDKAIFFNLEKAKGKPMLYKQENPECPFCDVETLHKNKSVLKEGKNVLWIKNKFPMLEDAFQTLIIETLQCGSDLTNYSMEHMINLFDFTFSCRNELLNSGEFKDAILFKNHNYEAGGSVPHPHMQIIGLKNQKYDLNEVFQSLEGPIVFEDNKIKITVSNVPITEFYEFNLIWEKGQSLQKNVLWIQQIIQYIFGFSFRKYNSYNLAYYENDTKAILKIIPRGVSSIYLLGYGLHQTPTNILDVAMDLRKFCFDRGLPKE